MLSIILPVYNGEKYLDECVNSVLQSGLEEYELIIIDDGSTDETPIICDEFANEFEFVKVIHTNNQGQGLARNQGINIAKGKYIAFLDADDTLEKDGLSFLMRISKKNEYDIISGTYYRNSHENKELIGKQFLEGELSRSGKIEDVKRYNQMKTMSIFGYLWNKIYRKEFLIENNLLLDDIRNVYMEDTVFNIRVFGKNPKYYHVSQPVYCYNIQDESTTRKYEPEIATKNVCMLEKLLEKLKEENTISVSMDLVVPLAIRSFCWSIVRNVSYEGNSYKTKLKNIKVFTKNMVFRNVVCGKNHAKELGKLPSRLERWFYKGCILLIKLKADGLLAFGFTVANPVMSSYINKNLK